MEDTQPKVDIKKLHEDFHALLSLMEEFRNSVIETFNELSRWYKETQENQQVLDSVSAKPSKNGRSPTNHLNMVDEPYDPLKWVSSVEIGSLFGIESRLVHNLAEKQRFRAIRLPDTKQAIRYSLSDAISFLGKNPIEAESDFLVTVEYTMAWLKITDHAVRNLVKRGYLGNIGTSGRIIIPFTSLLRYEKWVKSRPGTNHGQDWHRGILVE